MLRNGVLFDVVDLVYQVFQIALNGSRFLIHAFSFALFKVSWRYLWLVEVVFLVVSLGAFFAALLVFMV